MGAPRRSRPPPKTARATRISTAPILTAAGGVSSRAVDGRAAGPAGRVSAGAASARGSLGPPDGAELQAPARRQPPTARVAGSRKAGRGDPGDVPVLPRTRRDRHAPVSPRGLARRQDPPRRGAALSEPRAVCEVELRLRL